MKNLTCKLCGDRLEDVAEGQEKFAHFCEYCYSDLMRYFLNEANAETRIKEEKK